MNQAREKPAGPILVVIGTRPEAIKLAPVVLALRRRGSRRVVVCCSGQHRDLVHGALDSFGIVPDISLDTMLRSGDKWHPFPEEVNRCITGVLADWHFAPTAPAADNLRAEGVDASRIVLAGNTAAMPCWP